MGGMMLKNDFNVLGQIAWLWANSPMHQNWSVSLLMKNVIPAIENGQYLLLVDDGFPIAYCSWAKLTLESEVRYVKDTNSLKIDDWNAGDRIWIIDWIAPFGDSSILYKHMRQRFPYDIGRAIRIYPSKKDTGKIIYLKGGKITKKVAEKTFLQYEQELITALQ